MRKGREASEELQEFARFVAADPVAPRTATDQAVLAFVRKSIRPPLWLVLAKLTAVEVASGLATLGVCPQFDIGFGSHHQALHPLHAMSPPIIYYLACGLFFVLFGAALSGIVLQRDEIRSLGKNRYFFFVAYSLAAFAVFLALGAEVMLIGSLAWIGGAVLGNMVGFETVRRLRTAMN